MKYEKTSFVVKIPIVMNLTFIFGRPKMRQNINNTYFYYYTFYIMYTTLQHCTV